MFQIDTNVLFYQHLEHTWAVAANDTRLAIIKQREITKCPQTNFLYLFSFSSSELGDCQAYSPAGDAYEPRPLEKWHVFVPMTILHLCVELLYLYFCSWFSICALNVVSIVLYPISWNDTRMPLWLSYPLVSYCPKFQLQRRSSHHNSLVLLSTWSTNSSHDLIVLSFSPQYLSK